MSTLGVSSLAFLVPWCLWIAPNRALLTQMDGKLPTFVWNLYPVVESFQVGLGLY